MGLYVGDRACGSCVHDRYCTDKEDNNLFTCKDYRVDWKTKCGRPATMYMDPKTGILRPMKDLRGDK